MANTLKLGAGKWATGKDTVLSFNDENGNFKPLPFSFSRASNATVVNQSGLIETVGSGTPRIDFLGNTKGALLLEPTRSNLLPYSNDFSNSAWGKTNVTLTSNAVISPDGTLNASKIVATGSDGSLQDSITVTSGTTYTLSVYLKTVSGTLDTAISLGSPGFPQNEGEGGRYKNITVTNEWKRYTLTSTADASSATGIGVGGFNSFSTGEQVYVYGAQLEQGSYATSYIPTSGSAVTRVVDACSQTVPDGVIGQTEGTMFFEIDFANTSGVSGAWSISSGSSANRITMNTTNLSSTQFTLSVAQNYNSGSTKLTSANVTFSDNHKVAIKYSGTTLKLFVDGQLSDSVTADGFGNYTNFYVGGNQTGVGGEARKFIQADLYDTALTDSELIALTTI